MEPSLIRLRPRSWWFLQLPLSLFILFQTAVWSVISIILFLVESSGRLAHRYGARPWSRILLWASRVKVEVQGLDNLNGSGQPQVLVANHQSLFDILAVLAGLPIDFKFVVKKEIAAIPLWGQAMKRAGYISIDRDDSSQAKGLLVEAAERIRRGASVLFFPEGTRSADGRLAEFKRGAFLVVARSGCEVVPVVIEGSRPILPKKSWRITPGRILITVLEPITDPALRKNSKALMAEVRSRMLARLELGKRAGSAEPDGAAAVSSPVLTASTGLGAGEPGPGIRP